MQLHAVPRQQSGTLEFTHPARQDGYNISLWLEQPKDPLETAVYSLFFPFLDEEYWQIWTLLALSRRYDISL